MKKFVENLIKELEDAYKSLDRLKSDYNREKELKDNYRGRELLELLQNADDELTEEYPQEVKISFIDNVFKISNYGNPFSKEGIISLFYPNNSSKENKKKVIGNKGTGFRSILGWAKEIEIHSGDFHVLYSDDYSQQYLHSILNERNVDFSRHKAPTLAFPKIIEPKNQDYTTTISIKIDDNKDISTDIIRQIDNISDELILFLNNTKILIIETAEKRIKYIRNQNGNKVSISVYVNEQLINNENWIFHRLEDTINDEWYSVIVAYKESGIIPKNQVLYSYFPTKIDFPFPLLVHANFDLDGNRNHLIENNNNSIILDKVAELLVDTIKTRYSGSVSYNALEYLLNHEKFTKDLTTFDFEKKLNTAICKSKIFPTVTGKYISLESKPIFFETELAKYLNGKEFSNLLKNYEVSDDPYDIKRPAFIRIIKEKFGNYLGKFEYAFVVENLNKWVKQQIKSSDNKKYITKNTANKIAFTALEFVNEYQDEIDNYELKPCFMLNQACEQIDIDNLVYITSGELEISDPPKFSNIYFMNKELARAFKNMDINISLLSDLNVREADYYNIVKGINERIELLLEQNKKSKARQFCKTEIKWLWKNRDILRNEEINYPVWFLSRDGNVQKTDKLYYGRDYGNELCEKLYASVADNKFVCNIDKYISEDNTLEEKVAFLKMLGVADYPRIQKSWKEISDIDQKRVILKDVKYPFHIEKNQYFESVDDAIRSIKSLRVNSTNIDEFDEILTNADTIDILDWILNDNSLHRLLKDKCEQGIDNVKIKHGLKGKYMSLSEIKKTYSLAYYQFKKMRWIQVKNKRYSIDECLLTQNLNGLLEPILAEPDVGSYIKEKSTHGKRSALEAKYKNLLIELSVKTSFADLPIETIYKVFNVLSEKKGSEKIAKTLYSEVIKSDNTFEEIELKNSDEYNKFINIGKVYCNTGYQFCRDARYLDGRDICEKIAQKFNLIDLPQRMNRSNVQLLLGVKRLELKGTIVGNPEIHSINEKFQADFKAYKPLAFCYRIDAKKALEGEARKFNNLTIILCSKVRANYNDIESEIDDYEYILDGSYTYYLKIGNNINERNFRQDYELATAIGSIIAAYMGIGDLLGKCRSLFQQLNHKNREKQIIDDTGDCMIITRSKRALECTETVKDEFIEIMNQISPVDFSVYKKNFEKIDFDSFSSIENAQIIIDCFKNAKVDVSVYNEQHPSICIDLTDYYYEKVKALLPQYKELYMRSRYFDLLSSSIEEQMQLASLFAEFQSITINVDNSVYFNPEEELIFQLNINRNCKKIDLQALYYSNMDKWNQLNSYNQYVEEFLNNTDYQSLVYYGRFDELSCYYDKFVKALNSDVEKEANDPVEVNVLQYPVVQPKPFEHSSAYKTVKKTGFSHPNIRKKESIGRIGEKIVYNYLLKNKKSYTCIEWVSENAKKEKINPEGRAGLGYDFDIVLSDGRRQFIEVKSSDSSSANGITFYMSDYEFKFACEHSKDYIIFYVSEVTSKTPKISVFNDVVVDGEFNNEKFFINTKSEYIINAEISAD